MRRADLADDPRFATASTRKANLPALPELFNAVMLIRLSLICHTCGGKWSG
jgi:crotonobetainyl-CoA:carnitine CoA-transferase CaiB-like acyl-CoA transferase